MNMMMLFEEDFDPSDSNLVHIRDGKRVTHLTKILKVKVGKICKVGLKNGKIGHGEVIDIVENSINMRITLEKNPPKKLPLTLIIALQRPNTIKKILHSAISIGVKKIIFIGCFKVEKSYWDSSLLENEALEKEQILALEQCIDTKLIDLEFHRYFKQFNEEVLDKISAGKQLLLAHPNELENASSLTNSNLIDENQETLLLMGPEGGFTDYEVECLKNKGARQISLGERILRTEFAFTALAGRFLR